MTTTPPATGWIDDVRELTALRYELARAEWESDLRTARICVPRALAAFAVAVAGAGCLLVGVALLLPRVTTWSAAAWCCLLGGGLLVLGLLVVWAQLRRCRRDLACFRQTREELETDREWLGEWLDRSAQIVSRSVDR